MGEEGRVREKEGCKMGGKGEELRGRADQHQVTHPERLIGYH
jgi:hypothetical protein